MPRFSPAVLTALAASAFLLSGCSAVEKLTEKGGDTTCKEFNADDDDKQNAAVSAMLHKKYGKEASHLEIAATKIGVQAFCKTIGTDSSKISEVRA
ncbi:hypothetical protein KIH27_18320 [Mycobacterium sp. M1]|uniref:Acid stress chaperone HdeA n=1 Tax=Mycolicibacter acidiphilus TaxID=2835306 RepID=A0ABS5RML3_9MYCO|nr:hypothetical protein [Mycolicibacter acidiphilus]MBS9535545.1 hypothetical protein [Mycolicibacter acidiphilus]